MITSATRPICAGLVAVSLVLAVAGCGSGSRSDGACGPVIHEPLDPAYLVHVVGDGADLRYTSDPPTSGPHKAGPAVEGVIAEPIPRPVQVGILERGDILLQHAPDLPAAQRTELEGLAGPGVVVAVNADLPEPVVATAWTAKRTCTAVDVTALRAFVRDRAGKGPDS